MDRFRLSLQERQRLAYLLVGLFFLFLLTGLVKLQIVDHRELAAKSENNRIRVVPIVPSRGIVTDREERVIIDNRPSYTVSVVPAEEVPGTTLSNLAQLLNVDTTQLRVIMRRDMVSRYQPVPVKRDIAFEVIAVLEEQNFRFPGVAYQMERVRQYSVELEGEAFTGYVGEVSEEELKKSESYNLHAGNIVGKKGLEKQHDQLLRGQEGTAYIEVSAAGQILGRYHEKEPIPALPGANLTLTIDNDIQAEAARALDTFCCGAVVAIDPRNGEILAMTSYPGFNSNIFSSVIPESLWQVITTDSTHPLLNRPINGLYPPGSTVKFITVGAGLEEGLITENSTFKPCFGGMQFGNRYFRCWDRNGHGTLTAAHGIEQSCDVFMYQLGLKLGVDKLAEYYTSCGFGRPTGVDLPLESPGLIPTTSYYNKRYGDRGWTRMLVLNNAIGQGEVLVTPLQLAQFFCGLANHEGIVYQPHFVKKITTADGTVKLSQPKEAFRLPFSQPTLQILREGLRLVVEGDRGTARRLRNRFYSIGGKTGTAENPHGDNHSWFVGVAPLENPEIVVCALVENAGHGSDVAAPLVGQIIRRYMEKRLNLEPLTLNPSGLPR